MLPYLREEGSCNGQDPSIFFPDDEKDPAQVGAALAICSGCPALEPCYDYSLANEDYGIWGGTTARQRRSIRRKAKARSKLDD